MPTLTIPTRYCGPATSGNGGYVCGCLAHHVEGVAEVTLRQPPPLETPMTVGPLADGTVALHDGDRLIATARPATLDLIPPPPPDFDTATAASRHYTGFHDHSFPTCFVCGPDRAEGDGLRIFAGAVPAREIVAAPWTPDASLLDASGQVPSEILWAALDCPGAFAVMHSRANPLVLGRMTARIDRTVAVGSRCVVIGWPILIDGRKRFAGTALYDEGGHLCGLARQIWIEINA